MSTPYIGYGNDELAKLPEVKAGDVIVCPRCDKGHTLEAGKDAKTGEATTLLLFYRCRGDTYLAAVDQRLVTGTKPTVSGRI